MSEHSAIEWTDATFNPWWGCTKVSPACDNCYAERDAKRYQPGKVLWGAGSEKRTFGEKHWTEPLRWARTLPAKLGRRPRVFCASMADVFDKDAPAGERDKLWRLIRETPQLDWLLLTKRVGNVLSMLPNDWHCLYPDERGVARPGYLNVWVGITVVNQEEANRDIPKLLAVPTRVRFLSIEPMLGQIDLRASLPPMAGPGWVSAHRPVNYDGEPLLHWVIAGGESGPKARPAHPDWFRSLRDQCAVAGVPFLFKQWGEWAPVMSGVSVRDSHRWPICDGEPRGGVWSYQVGKKAAGRLLDGVTHDGYPTP